MPSTSLASRSCSKTSIACFCKSPSPTSPARGWSCRGRSAVFDLSPAERQVPYDLLKRAKAPLDAKHAPGGYTIGWNCEDAGGRRPSHLHAIPRFAEKPLAGKGLRFRLKQPANERAQPEE
jgi:diadenosine tetraphosphate (Ap4A) HIT family hydrolase